TRLTNSGANLTAFWDSSGRRIYYSSILSGIMDIHSIEVDGSGEGTLILHEPNASLFVTSMLRDGTIVCLYGIGSSDIGIIPPGDKTELKPILNKKNMELNGKISPDEHWLAYESNKEGQFEVYLCSYPNVEETNIKISVGGGHDPLWSIDGRELFYRSNDAVMAVSIETKPKLTAHKPVELFRDRYALLGDIVTWDINPKDGKFLMVKDYSGISGKEGATQPRINIILNWFEELKDRVPIE
ncbi:MAG: PD40 domain-containing protein, partial [Acidobacteria bacterium]|nr:PD40 domain-containing protein [Acidobacteriota bacterium]